jgi:hypothetical protein
MHTEHQTKNEYDKRNKWVNSEDQGRFKTTHQRKTRQDKTSKAKARQGKARQDKTRQDKTRQPWHLDRIRVAKDLVPQGSFPSKTTQDCFIISHERMVTQLKTRQYKLHDARQYETG